MYLLDQGLGIVGRAIGRWAWASEQALPLLGAPLEPPRTGERFRDAALEEMGFAREFADRRGSPCSRRVRHAGFATLLVVGVVTAIIENPLFVRMTPVRAQDYAIWLSSGVLMGLVTGTFVGRTPVRHGGKAISGGLLSLLAVGCPICNKLVVLLLGMSGALTVFGPAQLYLGALSIVLLAWTFRLRVRAVRARAVVPFLPGETAKTGAIPEA